MIHPYLYVAWARSAVSSEAQFPSFPIPIMCGTPFYMRMFQHSLIRDPRDPVYKSVIGKIDQNSSFLVQPFQQLITFKICESLCLYPPILYITSQNPLFSHTSSL